eukprot:COSAG06_NODE_1074_length_10817_cov_7.629315_1_plen_66_part_10
MWLRLHRHEELRRDQQQQSPQQHGGHHVALIGTAAAGFCSFAPVGRFALWMSCGWGGWGRNAAKTC